MLGANVDLLILVVFILQYYITSYTVTLKAKFYQFCLNLVGGIRFGPLVQFSFGTLLAGKLMNIRYIFGGPSDLEIDSV